MKKLMAVLEFVLAMMLCLSSSMVIAQPAVPYLVYPAGSGARPTDRQVDGEQHKHEYYIAVRFDESYCRGYDTMNPQVCRDNGGTWKGNHDGIDINANIGGDDDCGYPARASGKGAVVRTGIVSGFGNIVQIRHYVAGMPQAVYLQQAHLQSILVSNVGEPEVECCQVVGLIGRTPFSADQSCHLHHSVFNESGHVGVGYANGVMPNYILSPADLYTSHPPPAIADETLIGAVEGGESSSLLVELENAAGGGVLPNEVLLQDSFLCPYRCNGSTPFFGPPSAVGTNTTVYVHTWGTDLNNQPLLVQDFLRPLGGGRLYWS